MSRKTRFDTELIKELKKCGFNEFESLHGRIEKDREFAVWYLELIGALAVIACSYKAGGRRINPENQQWYSGIISKEDICGKEIDDLADTVFSSIYLQQGMDGYSLVRKYSAMKSVEDRARRHDVPERKELRLTFSPDGKGIYRGMVT